MRIIVPILISLCLTSIAAYQRGLKNLGAPFPERRGLREICERTILPRWRRHPYAGSPARRLPQESVRGPQPLLQAAEEEPQPGARYCDSARGRCPPE